MSLEYRKIEGGDWAEYIKLFRRMNDLTQAEFGKLVGCTRRCVSEWEARKTYPQKNKQARLIEIFEPVLPELTRELSLKREIQNKQVVPDSEKVLRESLREYEKMEPELYRLFLQIQDLEDSDVQIIRDLVCRLEQTGVNRAE